MINLLPDTEKQSIRKEYQLRVIVVILSSILIIVLSTFALLIPSYILTLYKGAIAQDIITKTPTPSAEEDFTERLTTVKRVAHVLSPEQPNLLPTEAITIISEHRLNTIIITSITYTKTETDPVTIHIKGIAENRKSLVDYTAALRSEAHIAAVNLPVSSFAADSDIGFEIDIKTK